MSTNTIKHTTTHVANARRTRLLEYLTISWNSLEGAIAISAGLAAGSIALVLLYLVILTAE